MLRRVMMAGASLSPGGDPHWGSVSALLHFDGADGSTSFIDEKGGAWASGSPSAAMLSAVSPKFGASSLLLSGSHISAPDSDGWHFGAGDFTVEAWVKPANTTQIGAILSQWDGGGGRSWAVFQADTRVQFAYSPDGVNSINAVLTTAGWSTSAWQHVAVSCNSGVLRVFINGGQVGASHTMAGGVHNSSQSLVVGNVASGGLLYRGGVDDLRITKGVGRYASNFTPPSSAFPDSA